MLQSHQNPLNKQMMKGDSVSSGAMLRADDYECGGGKIENTITVASDRNYHHGLQPESQRKMINSSMDNGAANMTNGSLPSINGIRVEQLCEILSREIGRVREESIQ